jgi:hypothetical protein
MMHGFLVGPEPRDYAVKAECYVSGKGESLNVLREHSSQCFVCCINCV